MTDDSLLIGDLLSQLLRRSPYIYFLARCVSEVGLRVGTASMLLDLNQESGDVSLQARVPDQACPTFWVECSLSALELAVKNGESVSKLVLRTGPKGQSTHPRVEQILLRCFQVAPFPIDDREDLIYPALFGLTPPRRVWQSKNNPLRVLHYCGRHGSFCVSSGLSESWALRFDESQDEQASAAGYELVMKSSEPALMSEFSRWVQYVERTETHICPGNWLEYEAGTLIPGSNIAGFLVSKPTTFLDHFPVRASISNWHCLIPVSLEQLNLAKQTDALDVASVVDERV